MTAKRKLLQAWFDASEWSGIEARVLEIFDFFKAQGWSQKQILGNALIALAEKHGDAEMVEPFQRGVVLTDSIQARIDALLAAADRLSAMTSNGHSSVPHQAVEEVIQDVSDFEASLADRYQPLKFDDEE
jgi:hypothetical protein